jgi:hypothetical protein
MAFAIGSLNWQNIDYWCSDSDCACGTRIHHCTLNEGSAQYFRCYRCEQVYAFKDQVRLLTSKVMPDDRKAVNPESLAHTDELAACIQWKGSDPDMSVACLCGKQFAVTGDCAYKADCPHCQQHYFVDWYVGLHRPSDEEIAQAAVIHYAYDEEPYE